jgi:hypothetical protein
VIRRRHVIYVQGYDPRGHAEYYRMFRGEYQNFLRLYGLSGRLERSGDGSDPLSSEWTVETEGRGWQVRTTYEFLRWEDIIRRDFQRPIWWVAPKAVAMIVRSLFNGVYVRIARAHWRFGLFIAYPFVLLALWLALGAFAGAAVAGLVERAGLPFALGIPLGIATGLAVAAIAIRRTESKTYLLYLLQDAASTAQYAGRQRPDWDERLGKFADRVVEAAQRADADEIVVVGHSSGSFLAVDVLARALERDPALGRRHARVALLTVGGNLPIVGFHPFAGWFRDRLARIASEPTIAWVDYQSRRDIMNFFRFDPVAGHRINLAARHNPTVRAVQFRNIVSAERFAQLRWRFFDLHFQFLRANEKPDAYDYFMIVAGPVSLAARAADPERALAAAGPDEAVAREALSALSNAGPKPTNTGPRTAA